MVDHRIHRALIAAGVLLLASHGAVWVWAIGTDGLTTTLPTVEAPPPVDPDRVYYRVTTAEGAQHVIDVSKLDAAQAVLTASARFGEGASLERIDPSEARVTTEEAAPTLRMAELLWLGAILLVAVWFLLAGSAVRKRFVRLDAVVSRLKPRLSYDAKELMEEAGVSARELRSMIQTINARLGTEFIWNERHDQVVDARLSRFALVLRYCPRCNTPAAVRIRADLLDVPNCTSCMAAFEGQELEHQRAQIVTRLLDDEPHQAQRPRPSRFSLAVFALWVALLPPVAVVYAQGTARGHT